MKDNSDLAHEAWEAWLETAGWSLNDIQGTFKAGFTAGTREAETFRIDAGRYRYLKDNHSRVWDGANGFSVDIDFEGAGESLDEAINAAFAGRAE